MRYMDFFLKTWKQRLIEAHEDVLEEHLSVAEVPDQALFVERLEVLIEELCTEAALEPSQRLRLWKRDHLTLTKEGRQKLLQQIESLRQELQSDAIDG